VFGRGIGAPEILLILAVVILLFGAKKLPELARGSGRALRIFKSETKGLMDDDEKDNPTSRNDELKPGVQAEIGEPAARPAAIGEPVARPAEIGEPIEQPKRHDQVS